MFKISYLIRARTYYPDQKSRYRSKGWGENLLPHGGQNLILPGKIFGSEEYSPASDRETQFWQHLSQSEVAPEPN